ncbi:hypothetical protein [Amycolatopsis sp. PS_44_ISF1]|uniref:hypothetical protein n=1 Tax=Amycolatopsis sp. PS_44_ISF1 TaxID=2974917 RepID=UPI0028DDB7A1|nr:hypothetical protein [Amycolatopsis sp. PS_44_ISF1]MDT8909987.1 hypothetical protein [Amycolatopsis sp. PS_44_ISF1]
MNDEVSVAELLVREGWGERVPPPSRSRWRMVAVMLAVVVGCGAAAVLVGFGTTANDEAARVTEMKVIEMPDRTGGAGGVSESNPPTIGGTSGGEGHQSSSGETSDVPRSSDVTSVLDPLNPRGDAPADSPSAHDSAPSRHSDPTTSAGHPSSSEPTTSSEPQRPTPPAHSSTPKPPPPCLLGLLFC